MKKLIPVIPLVALIAVPSAMARPEGIAVSCGTTVNWSNVKAAGVDFAFAKATEGNTYEDACYVNNMKNGKAAGILMAAYDFARPDLITASTEATYFWNFAGGQILADSKTLNPMIDFEEFSGHVGSSTYTAWFNSWSSKIIADGHAAGVSMKPVIYCSAGAGACDLTTAITLGAYIGSYNSEPPQTGNPWSCCQSCNAWDPGTPNKWSYWDTGSTINITGLGAVDVSVYNGTLTTLKSNELVTVYP